MGLFGFGKKKRQSEEAAEAAAEENDKADEAISETAEAPAGGIQETILPEPSDEYDGRGDEHGPWDVDDENVPDYDEYLDMGAYYLPFLQGIELRVKANRATQQVLGTTITYGSSSVEIEAFAAPKTMGLWDDVRADLVEANKDAKETDGVFGTELTLPVVVKGGRKVITRIVGVDGPRWMLRGIFSGKAATDPDHAETKALNQLCSLPEEEYVETLAQLMVQAAQTGREEVIFSPEDRRRVGKAAVARANELLAKAAAPDFQLGDSKVGALLNKVATSVSALAQGTAMLTLSEKTRDVRGGFILADQNVEVNCTFETLVRLQKNEIAGEVAKILFS